MDAQRLKDLDYSVIIKTREMHTGGEPVRIVISGYPEIKGDTILDKRRYVKEHLDHLRRVLMEEPRGHYDMYGVIPVATDMKEADMAVLFTHSEGIVMYSLSWPDRLFSRPYQKKNKRSGHAGL